MLGPKSKFASECFAGDFIGTDFLPNTDLTGQLPDDWTEFNRDFVHLVQKESPSNSKVTSGRACGMLHTICKGMKVGDVVVCPDGQGNYRFGRVRSEYSFADGGNLPHRRGVSWLKESMARSMMSEGLRGSTGSPGTVSSISRHFEELEKFLNENSVSTLSSSDETIESPIAFALEKHLEEFLVKNWEKTDLGKHYDIYPEGGEMRGQQYDAGTGWIDILAISKDRQELLVIELKKGRASDAVVGQIQRYMGYVISEVAEEGQKVKGCIIALDDDLRIQYALKVNPSIDFYRYKLNFELHKQSS